MIKNAYNKINGLAEKGRMQVKNITMADIAKRTGYSVNTVSHALNNKPDISEKTKKYITETAKEMGYIANVSAGALRSGKSKSAAIIVGDISNPHFSIMIKEMESRLRDLAYNAIIINTDENEDLEHAAIVSAISKNVDGIILCPVQKTRNNIDFLNKTGVPYVLFGRRFEGTLSSYVICDDVNGGFAAAEHLLMGNHKNILFINAPLYISSARDRLDGIKRAFRIYGTSLGGLQLAEVSTVDNGDEILEILKKNASCTGIICFSDLVAMQVCHFLKQLGKQVPKDVSVVGFDNIASKFYLPLMLTSVTSSKTKMSVKTVDTLINIIDGKIPSGQQHILPTKIVKRESTEILGNI